MSITEHFESETIESLKAAIVDLESDNKSLESAIEGYSQSLKEVYEMSVWEFANWKVLRWWYR